MIKNEEENHDEIIIVENSLDTINNLSYDNCNIAAAAPGGGGGECNTEKFLSESVKLEHENQIEIESKRDETLDSVIEIGAISNIQSSEVNKFFFFLCMNFSKMDF